MKKEKLIVLTGPTAVGKTRISLELARQINGEIISADSMQVYRHMDIGSAKILEKDREGISHHLIDILDPWDEFNVVVFQQKCKEAMRKIYERGHIPILTGGTGFYIQSVLYDVDFTDTNEDTAYRDELTKISKEKGEEFLHTMLANVDSKAASEIHPNNVRRVIRALEFYKQTGKCISAHNEEERKKASAYDSCYFVLNDDRDKLYQGINTRVDQMVEAGLIDEVKNLLALGCKREMVSMQGLGYKEIISCLLGECTLEEAINQIKQETRHFAKRQITWFKREKDVIWVNKPDFQYDDNKILQFMKSKIFQEKNDLEG